MFRTFTCPSSGVLIYRLFHCRMWCYAIGVEAVVLRSWCVVLFTVCQLVSNCLHQVVTSSLLIYMMHGHTYIKNFLLHIPIRKSHMVSCLGILGAKSVVPTLWVPCVQSIDAIFSITNGIVCLGASSGI